MSKRFLVLFGAALVFASLAFSDDDDPPGRAARLSYISGTVSFQPGSVEDWVPATLNRPMTTGDRLWTEAGARAEMHIGSAALRLNGRTNFSFLNLDDRTAQIQVSLGTLSVRLRRLEPDEIFEIDTPQMAFSLLRPGEYRVDVNEEGDTTIASVRGGEAEARSSSRSFTMRARQQVRASGFENTVYDERDIPPADAFDNWCADRDRREDMSPSGRYVSRDIPGYSDLDDAGVWREDRDYGWIWAPRVTVVGWAPYHYGHWVWIAPWGWTWVDDAPWGYAPFHYGRWVYLGGGWAWVPGPVIARPVYAPAMVAWIGGPNFSVGIGVGPAVGWFPLGPHEVWVPAHRYSPTYIERVNVTNTVIVNRTQITNVNVTNVTYVNRNVAGAVTVVPQREMMAGRPVGAAAMRVTPDVVARAEVRPGVGVAPDRAAVLGPRTAGAAAPPAAVVNRPVFARQTPPPAQPSFAQQQEVLRQNPGRPIPRSTLSQIQSETPQQGAPPRSVIRQVGPPPAAQRNTQPGPPQPGAGQPAPTAPVQASPRQFPPPAAQPEIRRAPAPPTAPAPQPERRRSEEPQVTRPPQPQQAPQVQPAPRPQPPPEAQPERRRPEPQVIPAPAPQPERRRPETQSAPAPARENPRQQKQEPRQQNKEERRRDKSDN